MGNISSRQHPGLPSKSGQESREPGPYLACSACHQEIPASAAIWRESSDYVAYFCGLDCFDKWRNQRGQM
jgi:hypothetical protein